MRRAAQVIGPLASLTYRYSNSLIPRIAIATNGLNADTTRGGDFRRFTTGVNKRIGISIPAADVNKRDGFGFTWLIYMCATGADAIYDILKVDGINVNEVCYGATALNMATTAAALALKSGDLEYATRFGDIIKILEKAGAKKGAIDDDSSMQIYRLCSLVMATRQTALKARAASETPKAKPK